MVHNGAEDAVSAFILERRPTVLADAIEQLATCSRDDLGDVAHAVLGTLGSYGLHAADGQITALTAALREPASTRSDIDEAWARSLVALRSMEGGVGRE